MYIMKLIAKEKGRGLIYVNSFFRDTPVYVHPWNFHNAKKQLVTWVFLFTLCITELSTEGEITEIKIARQHTCMNTQVKRIRAHGT